MKTLKGIIGGLYLCAAFGSCTSTAQNETGTANENYEQDRHYRRKHHDAP